MIKDVVVDTDDINIQHAEWGKPIARFVTAGILQRLTWRKGINLVVEIPWYW